LTHSFECVYRTVTFGRGITNVTVSQGANRPSSKPAPQAVRWADLPGVVGTGLPVRLRARLGRFLPVAALALILPLTAMTMVDLSEPDAESVRSDSAIATLEIALPADPLVTVAAPDMGEQARVETRSVRIDAGQTMGEIFASLGLPGTTLHRLLEHPGAREPLSRLRPGSEFTFVTDADGSLLSLQFERGENERVVLHIEDDHVREETQARAMQRRVLMASGEIRSSLFTAGEQAGMSHTAILELAKAFGYDIDFAQDLRVGDRFDVVYEEIWREGERLRSGDVLAATFVNQGKRHQVFRYQFADGRSDYFDADGRPMKKGFLRMPIDFARISSRFTSARRHPVLGTVRAHRGVDYAAATGTPIMSAGEGRVSFAGWKNGYGRTVILQHANNVSTLYGHMSRLGKYKTGSRVRQGDVIGYVGATGLASGPHLHYEFRVAGVHRDPLKVTMPKPEPLPKSELQRFRMQTQPLLAQLDLLAGGSAYAKAR
jgi:murein DD-endopeptidase MepM/ murein hydrolase activator NlpD